MAREHEGGEGAGGRPVGRLDNQYVRRLIEDEELRDERPGRLRRGAQAPTGGCRNGKGPTKALMDDKKVHKELRKAAE